MTERRERRRASDRNGVPWLLAVALLYFAREVFIPIALAALLAFLLAPLVKRLERRGLRRGLAVMMVIALTSGAAAAVGWTVLSQVYSLAVSLPQYQANVTGKIESLHLHQAGKLTSTMQMLTDVSREITGDSGSEGAGARVLPSVTTSRRSRRESTPAPVPAAPDNLQAKGAPVTVRVEPTDTSVLTVITRSVQPVVQPLTTAFVVVVFVVFMLLGKDDLRDRAIRLAGSSRMHVTTVAIGEASQRVSRYLLMQMVVNVTYGGVVGMALWRIGVPEPVLWAVLTALLRFVPYAGIVLAAAGPLLLAAAISPHWGLVLGTMALYGVLEVVVANVVEPMLYGSSTGVSPFAILIAAIFWTWLWGLPGLLLSTPMTVCLIVIGRHVPRLEFLGVLFGEEKVLEPKERFYQRILAVDTKDASRVLQGMLKTMSWMEVYDAVLVPALTMVEEARHTDEIDGIRVEELLQGIEEAVEESWAGDRFQTTREGGRKVLVCVPAHDLADEIACRLLMEVMRGDYDVRVLSAELLTADVLEAVEQAKADVVCVVGVPPQTLRQVRLRCHQVRVRFPGMVIAACVLHPECDLSQVRGRIPMEDAQHVVCSLASAKEYLTAVGDPTKSVVEKVRSRVGEIEAGAATESIEELRQTDMLDGPEEGVFERIASSLAKAFGAPIALINTVDGVRTFWRSQCGLPEEVAAGVTSLRETSICSQPMQEDGCLVVPDVAQDERFAGDAFLRENGIRFYAAAALRTQGAQQIGCLCVMDTRPRQVTEQQRAVMLSLADSVMNAIELRETAERVGKE